MKGFPGGIHKKFVNAADAESFARGFEGSSIASVPSSTAESATIAGAVSHVQASSPDAEDGEEWDVIYCDGACKGNGQNGSVAGIGVWWGDDDRRLFVIGWLAPPDFVWAGPVHHRCKECRDPRHESTVSAFSRMKLGEFRLVTNRPVFQFGNVRLE